MLGEKIKELRKKKKMTQQDVANKLKLAKSTISQYENNINEPDNKTLIKIADMFEVTVDYLLGRDPNPTLSQSEKEEMRVTEELINMLENIPSNKRRQLEKQIIDYAQYLTSKEE